MARPTAALLCLVLGLACMHTALGHAGSMHLENDPVDRNYQPRFVIGTCSPWQTLNPAANYALNGTAEIYVYPYRNCTEQKSSALVIDGYLTKDGLPAGYYNVSGEGYTGTCGTNSSLYVQDPASTNLNENRIWWRPFRTENVTGKFFGTAANSILIRSLAANGTFLDNSLRSFQLATPADGPILCCDITYDTTRNLTQEALSTALEANGVNICTSPPPPAPSPPPSGQLLPPAPPPPPGSAAALSMSSTAVAAAAMLLALML